MSIALSVLLLASPVLPDDVELTDGKVVQGKVTDLGDSIRVARSGGSVTFPKSLVRRIEYKKTVEEEYVEKARGLKDGDLDGHLRLARWCLEKKIAAEAAVEFRKVVALDPEHEEARLALGYRRLKDQWLTEEEYHTARGLVRHRGRWMTPEERDLEAALEQQRELEQRLAGEVKSLLVRARSSDPKRRLEAREGLERIDDKYKAKAFVAALASSHRETRGFVIEELGRMREPSAARPLARRAIWDDVPEHRGLALRSLAAIGHPDTALFFVPFLEEQSVSARIRCEDALSQFRDLRAVGPLLEALDNAVGSIAAIAQYGEQAAAVVNRTLILADGTRVQLPTVVRIRPETFDKEQKRRLEEERAVIASALRAITGQDFGDDPARWRAGLAKRKPGKE